MKYFFYRFYQRLNALKHSFMQVNLGATTYCKHNPSCSRYFANQVKKQGVIRGSIKGLKRILTCY